MLSILKDYIRMMAIGIILLTLLGGGGFLIQRTQQPDSIKPIEAAPLNTSKQDLLVDTSWLMERMSPQTPLVILDVSELADYAHEHIPGAVHLWWQDTMNLNGAGYGEAYSLSANIRFTPKLGAKQDDVIVVYDNSASTHASRLVWQLRTSGYGKAVVLDGGLAAWKGAGQPTSDKEKLPKDVAPPSEQWIADNEITTSELSGQFDAPNVILIDTRSEEQQHDSINDTIRVGQIPGSRSLPANAVMRDDGTFASPEELKAILAPLGLSPDSEIVVYGRFGVETGQVWLALHLAGYDKIRVYDDSWLAWGYDINLPIVALEN